MERNAEPLWTAKQVAEFFGVAEKTVRNHVYSGGIPAVKVGRNLRFRPEVIRSLVVDRAVEPAA